MTFTVLFACLSIPTLVEAQGADQRGLVRMVHGGPLLQADLEPGDRLVAGTCGLPGAELGTHLLLTLHGPGGAVEFSDDGSCDGTRIELVVPPGGGGTHRLESECFVNSPCPERIAWEVVRASSSSRPVVSLALELDLPLPEEELPAREPRVSADLVEEVAAPPPPTRGLERRGAGESIIIWLEAGQTLVAGTCGLEGARHSGDTTLRLYEPQGGQVAFNDDACGGLGSRLRYAAPVSGAHRLELGCYRGRSCRGDVAWEIDGAAAGPPPGPPEAGRIYDGPGAVAHVVGAEVSVRLEPGHRIVAGTCGVPGASPSGDTTLALLDPSGRRVAFNDDACGGLGSRLDHRAGEAGVYRIVPACYGGGSRCGGTIAWRIDERPGPAPYDFRFTFDARALLGPDGQGAVGSSMFEWRPGHFWSFRLEAAPVGLGGGPNGGIFAGGAHLTVGLNLRYFEAGLGAGLASVSQRPEGFSQREAFTFVTRARIGALDRFHIEGQLALAFLEDDTVGGPDPLPSFGAHATLPIDDVDIVLRGHYGFQGVGLGELALVFWPGGPARRGVGLSVHVGGSALFYQPVCRFGFVCATGVYAGPHIGFGLDLRP